MKATLLFAIAGSLFVSVAFGQTADEPLPVMTLGPSRLDLHPVQENTRPWSSLKLAITNRTGREWRFCKFYQCLSPILLSDTGERLEMAAMGNDASILPKITDFPVVKRGQSATGSRACAVVQDGRKLQFVIGDGAGGGFACAVRPGRYKLCLQYQFRHEAQSYFSTAVERFGLKVNVAEVWPGRQISNWIDLYVSPYPDFAEDETLPVVSLGPARLDLYPTREDAQWSSLKLAITNRSKRTWRFCKFYEGVSVMLLSDTGEFMKITGGGSDATMPPRITDFPVLKPGQSATGSRGCALHQHGQEFAFGFEDGTGMELWFALQPGHYKLCIRYRFQPDESHLFDSAVKHLGLNVNAADVWPGFQVSNWIDLYVNKPK